MKVAGGQGAVAGLNVILVAEETNYWDSHVTEVGLGVAVEFSSFEKA